jgi:hypothetical protein
MKVSGANVAEALRGPLGWLVVGGVVAVVAYFGVGYLIDKIEAPFKKLGAAVGAGVANTAQPISTDGGFYTGSDGVPSTDNETDTLTALNFGNLGA